MDIQISNSIEGWKATDKETGLEAVASFDEGKDKAIERLKEASKPKRKPKLFGGDDEPHSVDTEG